MVLQYGSLDQYLHVPGITRYSLDYSLMHELNVKGPGYSRGVTFGSFFFCGSGSFGRETLVFLLRS